ncbi:MHS family MFS transporter [Arthrobacter sp. FW305-BF8]|uniref:MFS transporter n=1 Tax=Arthrobacter sp. FW305-BF8 TaxID=2879617 RepID=UPI001F30A11C|nr:MFS transporter [Arthrobacter sp. FW305-BF8]UKA55414.1 MHS family MFS transporter [Arthrobacter sp. FW305-BF8]
MHEPTAASAGAAAALPKYDLKKVRRTAAASFIGTMAEYYDFFIYGTASALVFNKIFFPEIDPLLGTLAAFSTYAVGFFARPLGGIVWGLIGDRIGRKKALVYTLLITGLGTFAIGLLPTYETIGLWAAVILVLVRLIQGFGVGGEQGGAVLLTAEAAPPNRRGFFASLVQLGSPAAYLVPSALFAFLTTQLSEEQFLLWGWRVPFLLSIVVVAVGLYIRLRVDESETFKAVKENAASQQAPIKVIFKKSRREVFLGMGSKFVEAAVFPFYTVFLVAYSKHLGNDSAFVLQAIIIAIVAELIMIPVWGHLTDRFGRKKIFLAVAVLNLFLIWPAFSAIASGDPLPIIAILIAGLALGHAGTYAPQASYYPELFPVRGRYTGVSIVWQFGAMIASGPFTVVATALLAAGGGSVTGVAIYVSVLILISVVCLAFLPETAPGRLGGKEYADWALDSQPSNDGSIDAAHRAPLS